MLGAGAQVAVNAASSAPSSFVSTTPTRVLDTRTDVGLPGPFASGVSQKLRVTGDVATQPAGGLPAVNETVVPTTATAVTLNVTVVRPQTGGFLSIRPGDATGTPATSNINFGPDSPNTANSVTVALPATGLLDIYVDGTVSEVLIDIAGYFEPATAGPPGPKGDSGVAGISFLTAPFLISDATRGDRSTPQCPVGQFAIAGGMSMPGHTAALYQPGSTAITYSSYPDGAGRSWVIQFRNITGADISATVHTVCAEVAP
jgi:hypothetical protein